MKTIIYIIPYFGQFPDNFRLWLKSCSYNSSINWLIITDDKTNYNYPSNIKVIYTTFAKIQHRIQKMFDFQIELSTPYRLCDYKVAYGEIFKEEIKDFDFWGYCDIDMLWGDIRHFFTNELLNKYDRIGYLGHSTIYRNIPSINSLYRKELDGKLPYKEIFSTPGKINIAFDEIHINLLCDKYGIKTCTDLIFADLIPWSPKFILSYSRGEQMAKNRHRIFTWENGHLYSVSFYNKEICKDEFMYIHFLKRKMTIKNGALNAKRLLIVPNIIRAYNKEITISLIKRNSSRIILSYYFNLFIQHKNKITPRLIFDSIIKRFKARKKFKNKYKNIV